MVMATYLHEHLGARMSAFALGFGDEPSFTRYVRGYAPGAGTQARLTAVYDTVRVIVEAYDGATARAWLFGTNGDLDGRAPIIVLREEDDAAEYAAVLGAARAFVRG